MNTVMYAKLRFKQLGVLSLLTLFVYHVRSAVEITRKFRSLHRRSIDRKLRGGWSPDGSQASSGPAYVDSPFPVDHNATRVMSGGSVLANATKPFWTNGWRAVVPTRLTERIFRHAFSLFFSDPDLLKALSLVCSFILWLFLALSLLTSAGLDTRPLLSLLSISGLTIGFASKDILTNTFAGLFVLFTRPFKRGWVIQVR
jgi:hypothetical protein